MISTPTVSSGLSRVQTKPRAERWYFTRRLRATRLASRPHDQRSDGLRRGAWTGAVSRAVMGSGRRGPGERLAPPGGAAGGGVGPEAGPAGPEHAQQQAGRKRIA